MKQFKWLSALTAVLLFTGCQATHPPALGTAADQNLAAPIVASTADANPGSATTRPADQPSPVLGRSPVVLGVVEINALAPADAVLTQLAKRTDLFSKIVALPGGANDDKPAGAEDRMTRISSTCDALHSQAEQQGVDYILFISNDIDTHSNSTILSVLDISIVGCFIVPSDQVLGSARGLAMLVDARTSKVILTTSSDQTDWAFVPAINSWDAQQNIRQALGAKVNLILAQKSVDQMIPPIQ